MIENDKGIGLLPEKFFNLQHSDKVTIVPLKEKVSRSLAIAWDKDKLLTEDEQNFLEYTKKWFDSLYEANHFSTIILHQTVILH